jgi:hypothetical protein
LLEPVHGRRELRLLRQGVNLLKAERAAESIAHLRAAVHADPFDNQAARLLFQAYGAAQRGLDQRRLARERRLLRAAPQAVPADGWITQCPPVAMSWPPFIVLCCNQVEYTRQCLESVLRHTRPPYELLLVDNGSTDGTAEYLRELDQRSRYEPEALARGVDESNDGRPVAGPSLLLSCGHFATCFVVRCKKMLALLALLPFGCRKSIQSRYLCLSTNRATVALLALYVALFQDGHPTILLLAGGCI